MPSSAMISVTRRYTFSAAHHLPLVHDGHKCKRVHGHNYKVDIKILTPRVADIIGRTSVWDSQREGFLIDFWDLDEIVDPVIKLIDHYDLNEIPGLENPTAEHIAHYLYSCIATSILEAVGGVSQIAVTVYEEDDCWATFSNDFDLT